MIKYLKINKNKQWKSYSRSLEQIDGNLEFKREV